MQRKMIFIKKIIWKSTPLKLLKPNEIKHKLVSDTTGLHPRWSQLLNRQFLQIKLPKLLHFKLKWYEFQTSVLCQRVVYTGMHNIITLYFCYAPVLAFYFTAPLLSSRTRVGRVMSIFQTNTNKLIPRD